MPTRRVQRLTKSTVVSDKLRRSDGRGCSVASEKNGDLAPIINPQFASICSAGKAQRLPGSLHNKPLNLLLIGRWHREYPPKRRPCRHKGLLPVSRFFAGCAEFDFQSV